MNVECRGVRINMILNPTRGYPNLGGYPNLCTGGTAIEKMCFLA